MGVFAKGVCARITDAFVGDDNIPLTGARDAAKNPRAGSHILGRGGGRRIYMLNVRILILDCPTIEVLRSTEEPSAPTQHPQRRRQVPSAFYGRRLSLLLGPM
jgi:hypothetical protein